MERRTFLSAGGTIITVSVAGCAGDAEESGANDVDESAADDTELTVTAIRTPEEEIVVGEQFHIEVDVENEGEETDERDLTLEINGSTVSERSVQIPPEGETVQFDTELSESGEHEVVVDDTEGGEITTVAPESLITVTDVRTLSDEVRVNDQFDVEVTVENDGEDSYPYELELETDTAVVQTKSVSVPPGDHSFQFSAQLAERGEYTPSVDGVSGQRITITEPVAPSARVTSGLHPEGGDVDRRSVSDDQYEYFVQIDNTGNAGEIKLGLFWVDELDEPNVGDNATFVDSVTQQFDSGEAAEMAVTAGAIPDDKDGYALWWAPAALDVEVSNRGGAGEIQIRLIIETATEAITHKTTEGTLDPDESIEVNFDIDIQKQIEQDLEEYGDRESPEFTYAAEASPA